MSENIEAFGSADIVREIRNDMSIALYKPQPEFHTGAPTLHECGHHNGCDDVNGKCVESITCPCGDDHLVTPTSYGFRAQCTELGVRWTCMLIEAVQIGRTMVRTWVAEPYDEMSIRTTK